MTLSIAGLYESALSCCYAVLAAPDLTKIFPRAALIAVG
jgi:hypothetical protein